MFLAAPKLSPFSDTKIASSDMAVSKVVLHRIPGFGSGYDKMLNSTGYRNRIFYLLT